MPHDKRIAKRAYQAYQAACRMAEKLPGFQVWNHLEEITLHFAGYAEPGYDDPSCGIIAIGNWNSVTEYDRELRDQKVISDLPERLGAIFEKLGIECEWSDEWAVCEECNRLIRTEPDSHSWKRSYVLSKVGYFCKECDEKYNDEGNGIEEGEVDTEATEGD